MHLFKQRLIEGLDFRRRKNVKKILAISALTAAGLFAQALPPANPPAGAAPAAKAKRHHKKHHHKKAAAAAPATPAVPAK